LARKRWSAVDYPIRYFVIAGLCLVMHNCIVVGASWSGLNVWQSAATSFCVMVMVGYVLLAAFVFAVPFSWPAFLKYLSAMAANFPISAGLLWLFFARIGLPMVVAAPIATLAMVGFNFVVSRWAVAGRLWRTPSPIGTSSHAPADGHALF
jgi:putative flippase GtrA